MNTVLCTCLLAAVLSCCAAVPHQRMGGQTSLHPRAAVQQTPCETCVSVISDAEDYLAKPATQDTIVTFLQDNLCVLLPTDTAHTCKAEARVMVAQAAASMEEAFPPKKVCAYLGTCDAGQLALSLAQSAGLNSLKLGSLKLAAKAGFPVECPVCKLVFTSLLQRLKDPESRAEIFESAYKACEEMTTPEAKEKCKMDVEKLFATIDSLLDDMDAGRACQVFQFCGGDGGAGVEDERKMPEGVLKLKELADRMQGVPRVADPDSCDACKSVVGEVVAMLMDPDTQKEMLEFIKQGCDSFDDYKEMCEEYVDEYGPFMFGIVISYFQPEMFCERLGYCDNATLVSSL